MVQNGDSVRQVHHHIHVVFDEQHAGFGHKTSAQARLEAARSRPSARPCVGSSRIRSLRLERQPHGDLQQALVTIGQGGGLLCAYRVAMLTRRTAPSCTAAKFRSFDAPALHREGDIVEQQKDRDRADVIWKV
jgi:hypothetical protein